MGKKDNEPDFSKKEVRNLLEEIAETVVTEARAIGDDEKETLYYHTYYPKINTEGEFGVPVIYEQGKSERVTYFTRESRIRIENEINPDTYQRLIEIINNVFERHGQIGAHFFFDRLLQEPENRDKIIRIALEEILQVPADWKCAVFLNGLVSKKWHKVNEITIRPPVDADFKTHKVLVVEGVNPAIPLDVRETKVYAVSSVLEFVAHDIPRGIMPGHWENYEKVVSAIKQETRLLKLSTGGGWKFTSWAAESDSVMAFSAVDNRFPMEVYRISLGIFEFSHFKEREKDVYNLVRHIVYPEYINKIENQSKKLRSALRAMELFNEASIRPPLESLLFSIIGLESILLRDSGEMRLKLSTRTAVLLECLGYSRSEVFRNVYNAYKVRSEFVHGDIIEDDDTDILAPKILEYLRFAILMWLDSGPESAKEEKQLQENLGRASMQEEKLEQIQKCFQRAIGRFSKKEEK